TSVWPGQLLEREDREPNHQHLSQRPRADRDVVTVTQGDAASNGLQRDVDFRSKPKGAVAQAAQRSGKVLAAIVTHLPQCVAGHSHIEHSEGLARAALNLNRSAARDIDVPLALVEVVACQLREMPGPRLVEVHGASRRELMCPVARPDPTARSRDKTA